MTYPAYSRQGTPFGAKGPFYDPTIGHRGVDFYASAGDAVVAYEDMVIEYVGSSSGLGLVVGARLAADGKHAGWAHLRGVQSFTNGWVPAGTKFAEVAGRGDNPGSLWDGAHIHTTLTPVESSSRAAALGNTPLEDPAPRIAAASGSASAGRPTPAQEDDMFNDEDRYALNLVLNSQKRVEDHAWHVHSVIDQLRFAIIGNEPNQQLRLKLDQIQAELEKDYPKPAAS
ncbi:M23 family metallopeptidase [Plantibacter auratus]|uniref:M23 family metallopeptidase n=1 Tax=Plantibacter auratus TaxID=272914 RepID=UPI003D3559E6